ncbi:MAG TPA: bifunctional 4-hydroxy-2-oxoglutarate aldolase/2-dehydro-3-deoxy-phosphogluconate aldolase [Candidatus Acidoferrales bacterium]|nr:bifunctional 4-hydroxy-2-oxoglutarate aldolase/2-dehydro-3-deoxy-phosphogluconate aldolase [Candidatus Acidoferrales bacterium]
MDKLEIRERLAEIGIIPVVRASSPEIACITADAVAAGGIPIVEITMTVPGAIEVIRDLTRNARNGLLIGAGTVLDVETAERCIEAGAKFLVSPVLDLKTVALAARRGVVMIAGALTPTEILTAWDAGSDFVKVFPCGSLGGPAYLKALRGPLPQVPLVPTGGVSLETAGDFIRAGAAALGVGNELLQPEAPRAEMSAAISRTAARFAAIVREVRSEMTAEAASQRA